MEQCKYIEKIKMNENIAFNKMQSRNRDAIDLIDAYTLRNLNYCSLSSTFRTIPYQIKCQSKIKNHIY